MNVPLDELYFRWLYGQVADPDIVNPYATHWRLLRHLYSKEFLWFVPNDDNRVQDGKDLREEFAGEFNLYGIDEGWMNLPCSMLELLIALARKLAFEAEGKPKGWFWTMMQNLDLEQYSDRRRFTAEMIDEVLDRVMFRKYDYSGSGGLFPLREPDKDQRGVEIWYQMCAYVLENT